MNTTLSRRALNRIGRALIDGRAAISGRAHDTWVVEYPPREPGGYECAYVPIAARPSWARFVADAREIEKTCMCLSLKHKTARIVDARRWPNRPAIWDWV